MIRHDEVFLHLDGKHMGVGGDDGWMPHNVHDEFLLNPGRYHYAFRLQPLISSDDPLSLARIKISNGPI
jgi:hypothetical protein